MAQKWVSAVRRCLSNVNIEAWVSCIVFVGLCIHLAGRALRVAVLEAIGVFPLFIIIFVIGPIVITSVLIKVFTRALSRFRTRNRTGSGSGNSNHRTSASGDDRQDGPFELR